MSTQHALHVGEYMAWDCMCMRGLHVGEYIAATLPVSPVVHAVLVSSSIELTSEMDSYRVRLSHHL